MHLLFLPIVPTGPPQTVIAMASDPTVLTLTWSQPVPERRNGLIQHYIISVTELDTRNTELLNTTEEMISIPDRHPFYRYSYIVAAVTIGQGPFSVASIIHMPEGGTHWILMASKQSGWSDFGLTIFFVSIATCTTILLN